ncbi:hypothetical protein ONS95_012240 [Cadophora gregata]|uniref:uncharacterized protein n=1 Tax=Cadophora gregata TaxID=51156 RepID=UPI0026DC2B40|nr:uncharacterized protein ONS95_012240 [Cadophora gregata]KAK0117928.1 hypothetical protein ONS95_012240 [Cadophora gregata]KAK0122990.1 hypothetical protein ONS96_010005 [Cadophora gregata f. sp. sojae]
MSTSEEASHLFANDKIATEHKRLNIQHRFVNTFGPPEQIHPSIPKDQIILVADIATGTGVWLQDLATVLSKIPLRSDGSRQYVGFDISRDLFPSSYDSSFSYVQHNALCPFPDEHLGKYDLVHARFLIAALKEDEIRIALENVLELLAPGGYIQWDEWDFPDIQLPSASPAVKQTLADFLDFSTSIGFSPDIASVLHSELSQDSTIDQYILSKTTWYSLKDEGTKKNSRDVAREWWIGAVRSLWPVMLAMTQSGQVRPRNEVEGMVGENVAMMERVCNFLYSPYMIFRVSLLVDEW